MLILLAGCALAQSDVAGVFARAERGGPLRVVALGGSITQAGEGWMGAWLRQRFPQSAITLVNSGMSGTGSALGIFRLERDVMAHQPDLVAIEFCVNDQGMSDEDTIRYLETIVVRLKRLPHPPAIVFIQAAARHGVNLARHRLVARHYGLLEIDLQEAVSGQPWEKLFTDDVHPNEAGHEFYREAIARALARIPPAVSPPAPLPPPLSSRPLLLDATMVALPPAEGWKRLDSLGDWWDRFFLGAVRSGGPGALLRLPVRGTTFGVFFAMKKGHGGFFSGADDNLPVFLPTGAYDGYGFKIFARDLPAREHIVSLAVPGEPVALGYLLVAGQAAASREPSPPGPLPVEKILSTRFMPLEAWAWKSTGPWREISAPGWVNLQTLTPDKWVLLRATVQSARERQAVFELAADYFAKVWLNGQPVPMEPGDGRNSASPFFGVLDLRPGANELLLQIDAGSAGFGFSARLGD